MNMPMCAAAILLCLTLFSVHLSSGVVARYSTNSDGNDDARVITFGELKLSIVGGDTQHIIPGMPLKLNAAVSFEGSESATYVFLEVTPTGNCEVSADGYTYAFAAEGADSGASWTVDTTYAPKWTFLKKDGNTYVYYISLGPNVKLTNRTLFKNTEANVDDTLNADQLATLGTISASFRAGVVQSNGFSDEANPVEAAWNSLKAH